jgi:ABC-type hemin transport system ATPase subunit
MAVTLWKAEYHHLAFLDEVMGSQSSMAFSFSVVDMLEGRGRHLDLGSEDGEREDNSE